MGKELDTYAVVSLVKNEREIIGDFLDQLIELFDTIVLVDHESRDGTYEICRSASDRFPSISLYRQHGPGFPQAAMTTMLCHHLFARVQPRWLFFLDADEFLPFSRRGDFVAAMMPHAGADAIEMSWRNMVPEPFGEWTGIRQSRFITTATPASPYVKIALALPAFRKHGKRLTVWMGSHGATTGAGERLAAERAEFELYHLPFRSALQVESKLFKGKIGKLGRLRVTPELNHHQDVMLDSYLSAPAEFLASVPQLVLSYGERSFEASPKEPAAVGAPFSYPRHTGLLAVSAPVIRPATLLWLEVERMVSIWRKRLPLLQETPEATAATEPLLLTAKDGRIVDFTGDAGAAAPAGVSALETAREPEAANAGATEEGPAKDPGRETFFLRQFLLAAARAPLCFLSEDGSDGHVGLLHALIGLCRPTSVVQVGVRCGGDILAVGESIRRHDLVASVVGIDPWPVSAHGGEDAGAREFADFSRRLMRYPFIRLLRSEFDEGRRSIPEGTVDLLIFTANAGSGEAVARLPSWLSSLSRQGICVFFSGTDSELSSDTQQRWAKLKERWPAVEFAHGQGLRVLFVGEEQNPDVRELLRFWSGSAFVAEVLRGSAADRATTCPVPARLAEIDRRAAADREQARCLQAVVREIHSSRIWRWTAPLRAVLDRVSRGRNRGGRSVDRRV